MTFASRIREARRAAGLSQSQLADLMKVTRSACSQWEVEGGTAPRGHRFERLAAILNVTVEWLATGEGDPQKGFGTGDDSGGYRGMLTEDERTLLERFAMLGDDGQQALLALLSRLSRRRR
jgi:transcriptional regulator with XRE-family HTH domain